MNTDFQEMKEQEQNSPKGAAAAQTDIKDESLEPVKQPTMPDKYMKDIHTWVQIITEVSKNFSRNFTDENGIMKDVLGTKERERERKFVLEVQRQIHADVASIKEHQQAEFKPEDKAEIVKVNKYFKNVMWYVVGGIFVGALFSIGGVVATVNALQQSDEIKAWYNNEYVYAAYGHFVRKHDRDRWDYWYSGTWPRKVEKQDSIRKAHQFKKWNKE